MSSIQLTQDHESHKAGDIISVPFHVGKELITKGLGHYWNGGDADQQKRQVRAQIVAREQGLKPGPLQEDALGRAVERPDSALENAADLAKPPGGPAGAVPSKEAAERSDRSATGDPDKKKR